VALRLLWLVWNLVLLANTLDASSKIAGRLMFNSRRLHLQALIFALMFIGVGIYEGWKALMW
jgi:hypothetical protein